MRIKLFDNTEKDQFEYRLNTHLAKIDYIIKNGKIYLTHTEVPKELEGKGIGSNLVKSVLEEIKNRKLDLVPLCPFVAAYIKRHPEWNDIVWKNIKIK